MKVAWRSFRVKVFLTACMLGMRARSMLKRFAAWFLENFQNWRNCSDVIEKGSQKNKRFTGSLSLVVSDPSL
jgi:hypothetical protein